jgi:spermidine/putrescine transport system ATP-binding protein
VGDPLIHIADVSKRYGDFLAVDRLSLDIQEGAFVAIMGPSGCGKTTTLRMIAGLEAPSDGEIYFRGASVTRTSPWERNMPLVWQSLALFPFLNVIDNVAFGLKMARIAQAERHARAQGWLERLGIGDFAKRSIASLSGGQQQRVALARALVTEPRVLLLDEPLSALDPHLVVRMQTELTNLQRQLGITFVYVTHSQSEAFAMSDQVVIMDRGTIQQIGTPREVSRVPANRFVAEFVGTNNVISARVSEAGSGRAMVDSSLGRLAARPKRPVQIDEEVDVVISADLISIGATAPPTGNVVKGRVAGEQFVGSAVTIYVDMPAQITFRVQLPLHEFDRLSVRHGDEVLLVWKDEDSLILPRTGEARPASEMHA